MAGDIDACAKQRRFYTVGIGASAGGLEALERFFAGLPQDPGVAIVIVQHLSPDHKSLMSELLSRETSLPVKLAENGMELVPNCVFLIPPRHNMTVSSGKLWLHEQEVPRSLNFPITLFLQSLAEDFGENSVGIILSGAGSDGALGIRAIKTAGGLTMVQDEATAQFGSMPESAISTGVVDFIIAPEAMGELIHRYIRSPGQASTSVSEPLVGSLAPIFLLLKNKFGVDFSLYKDNTLSRRIHRRMSLHQITTVLEYEKFLLNYPVEIEKLYQDVLIGVTRFFRDPESFAFLQREVIPQIFMRKPAGAQVRVWSVGCSTGEEAYTLAILFAEALGDRIHDYDIKIFATDANKLAIDFASVGVYPENLATLLPAHIVKKYFVDKHESLKVIDDVRRMIIFAGHNILKDAPFSKIDLVVCRNLLIYLRSDIQKRILSVLHFSLNQEGFLFLGSSETIGTLSDLYSCVDSHFRVYTKKSAHKFSSGLFPLFASDGNNPIKARSPVPAPIETVSRQDSQLKDVVNVLFEKYVPSTIILNDNYELIHVYNDVNRYLKISAGKSNLNISRLVREELSPSLTAALHRAHREHKAVSYLGLPLRDDDKAYCIDLHVIPLAPPQTAQNLFLVSFQHSGRATAVSEGEGEDGIPLLPLEVMAAAGQRTKDLETELQYTRENLQAVIEELETSNEEMQATNEELLASNEELQSTNEELQSLNEELHTVNSQYESQIQELVELNNDIDNVLRSSDVAIVFLDKELRVRKFNDAVTREINFVPSDVGRPFVHFSHSLRYATLEDDLHLVLQTGRDIEKEVMSIKGKWFLLKLLPYRREDLSVHGVLLQLVNISSVKETSLALIESQQFLQNVVDAVPAGVVLVNDAGVVRVANRRWRQMAERTALQTLSQYEGLNYLRLCETVEGLFGEHYLIVAEQLQALVAGKCALFVYDYPLTSKLEQLWFRLTMVKMSGGEGRQVLIYKEEMTLQHNDEERGKGLWEVAKVLTRLSGDFLVVCSPHDDLPLGSPALETLLGVGLEHLRHRDFASLFPVLTVGSCVEFSPKKAWGQGRDAVIAITLVAGCPEGSSPAQQTYVYQLQAQPENQGPFAAK